MSIHTDNMVAPYTETQVTGDLYVPQCSAIVTNPIEKVAVGLSLTLELMWTILRYLKNPFKVIGVVRKLKQKYQRVFGEQLMTKVAKVDGRYYWRFATPGFPSVAGRRSRANEVNRVEEFRPSKGLGLLLLGITKKCPLACEHCYEWDRMHAAEQLSQSELISIVKKYQAYGTTQIMFGGGEPLSRLDDIGEILRHASSGTDFWISTSGWGLNNSKTAFLKSRGLTGTMISLDHHVPIEHDNFRGRAGAFRMAVDGAISAKKAGLVTGLALCPTKEYTTPANLRAYMEVAKSLGVTYVQLLEPRPVGRYAGKDIMLSASQLEMLEDLYLTYNQEQAFKDYPIVNYVGYHQRRTGCFGAGDYFFYIDTDGDAHACPFCAKKICNAREHSAEETVTLLKAQSRCLIE